NRLGHPVSWAYQVKGIANPASFQIIQPVDSESEQIIRRAIARAPQRPQLQDYEKPITTAIKGLTNRDKLKPEHIKTIENSLANPQITSKDWKLLFDKLGAKDAIKDKIYTLSSIRLLTLKAMVLPETLPSFLSWIQKSNNKKNYNILYTLQNQVYRYYKSKVIISLVDKVKEGIIIIIPQLVEQPELLDSTVWLLGERQGIWGYLYITKIMPAIDRDLQSIAQAYRTKQNELKLEVLSYPAWETILKNIQPYWQHNADKYWYKDYKSIANFFLEIQKINKSYQELKLYALFLYISQGKIPKKLYFNLDQNIRSFGDIFVYVYDIPLEREIRWWEKIKKRVQLILYEKIIYFSLVLILIFIVSIIIVSIIF
ncbi:MAG: hypothetical protein AB4372_24570, partial [Xenococcus sp. (in: cyanobacteria)]